MITNILIKIERIIDDHDRCMRIILKLKLSLNENRVIIKFNNSQTQLSESQMNMEDSMGNKMRYWG